MKGTRRQFIGQSAKLIATGLAGSSVLTRMAQASSGPLTTTPSTGPASPPVRVTDRRTLGRTGLKVSVVSLGASNETVTRYAIDHGVNFFHTSTGYGKGKAIRELGKAIKGQRSKVCLGLKVTWDWTSDKAFEEALKGLGTDYVDIAFFNIHNNPEKVASPAAKEAFDRWKKQGKAKFLGLTCHQGMKECLDAALKTGWYDCLMPSYNLSLRADFLDIFKRCETQKVGLIAMKTKIKEDQTQAIPVLLADRALTTLCKGAESLGELKSYIEATHRTVTPEETKKILQLTARMETGRCAMCGACTTACPNGVAVGDLVRCVNYYVDTMDNYEAGRENYHALAPAQTADHCRQCGRCETACPNQVPIRSFLRRGKAIFT